MPTLEAQKDFEKKSVSLRRDQIVAITRIAKEQGKKRFSRVVQEAIDRHIEQVEAEKKGPVAA